MSIWTHVAGIIRVDDIRFENPMPDFEHILGKQISYEELDRDENTSLPCGSEGTLQYDIATNPDISSLDSYTISIHGDLRDYDDIDEIVKWFKDVISNVYARQAIIKIECEDGKSTIAYLNSKGEIKVIETD